MNYRDAIKTVALVIGALAVVVILINTPPPLKFGSVVGKDHYLPYDTTYLIPIPIISHHPDRWVLHIHGCDDHGCRDQDAEVTPSVYENAHIGDDWKA